MKRKISLFLILAVLFTALASPVAASETGISWINLLDYGTLNNTGYNHFDFTGQGTANFPLPDSMISGYVDIIFKANSSVTQVLDLNGSPLTLISLGDFTYRAFGKPEPHTVGSIKFTFVLSSSSAWCYLTVLSCRMSLSNTMYYPGTGQLAVGTSYWSSSFVTMPDANTPATVYIDDASSTYPTHSDFVAYIYPGGFKRYDYMDLYLQLRCTAINSFDVMLGDTYIPFEMSYFYNSTGDWVPFNPDVDTYIPVVANEMENVNIVVRLDLSSIDRTTSDSVRLTIRGQYQDNNSRQYVSLQSVTGFIDAPGQSTFAYWMMKISSYITGGFSDLNEWLYDMHGTTISILEDFMTNIQNNFVLLNNNITSNFDLFRKDVSDRFTWLKNWINAQTDTLEAAIRGDSAPGDAFQDDVFEKDQQFNDMAAVMDSVNKPSLDSINVNVDQYVAAADITLLTSPLLVFLTGDIFGPIIIMTLILATVSYVLYGKRG